MKKETTSDRKNRELLERIETEAAMFERMTPAEQEEELLFRQKMSLRLPAAVRAVEEQTEEMEEALDTTLRFLAAMAVKYPAAKDDILAFLTDQGNAHFYTALKAAH